MGVLGGYPPYGNEPLVGEAQNTDYPTSDGIHAVTPKPIIISMDRQKPLLKCEALEAFCSSRRLNSARVQRVSKFRLAEPIMPFLWLVCLFCLCSCRSADISSYVSMSDTTYIHTINHDSIHTIDSVYIFQNDTTRVVYKSRNNYIYKVSKDTLYKVVRDTIYTANIQKSAPSKNRFFDYSYFWIFVLLLLILVFIYKKFK